MSSQRLERGYSDIATENLLLPPVASSNTPPSSTPSSIVHISQQLSATTSPRSTSPHPRRTNIAVDPDDLDLHDSDFEDWDDQSPTRELSSDMPSDLRPQLTRPTDGRSHQPLLSRDRSASDFTTFKRPSLTPRTSTFRERDSLHDAHDATKKKYTYAAAFLVLSLISFTVQTETAVYIQHTLKWNKAYCML